MASTTNVLFVLLLLVLKEIVVNHAGPGNVSNKKVMVQVMYESLCPDSIHFIKEQLTPTYESLGSQKMVVEFVPYGKATTYPTDTGYAFRCQHGPSECRGNKLQACALARLIADNKKQVKFVNCVMSMTNPSRPGETCFTEAGLEVADLKDCVSGREGQVLLAGMGEKTPRNIDFVPTVSFNNEFKQDDQDEAQSNLIYVVCDKLAPSERPSVCDRTQKQNVSSGWFFWG